MKTNNNINTKSTREDMRNPAVFAEFEAAAEDEGYDNAKHQPKHSLMAIWTENHIKHEIKHIRGLDKVCGVTGAGRPAPVQMLIKKMLKAFGVEILRENVKSYITYEFKNLNEFFKIAREIEKLEDIIDSRSRRNPFGEEEDPYDPMKIAKGYFHVIETKNWKLMQKHRILLTADDFDDEISINSLPDGPCHREHIVPCIMIHNKVIDMIMDEDATLKEVADFIERNMKIAYITPEDADHLDHKLRLKTTMPKGWEWGDSITARLDYANIEWKDEPVL